MAFTSWQKTIVDDAGDILPGATIEVRLESSGALATIYSDDSGTAKSNPFTADGEGFAIFYAAAGLYKITATSGAFSKTHRYVPIGSAQSYDVGDDAGGKLLTRDQMDARYGAVRFFGISGNITLDSTHNGRTGYITGNAVITLPSHSASTAGYAVELIHDTPETHTVTVAAAGTDTVRGSLTTITGDAAVVRTPTAGQWATIGDVSA